MSLLNLVTGGKSKDASREMDRALAAIQGVKVPTAEDLQFKIQQLVQAGKITPEQAKTFLQNPSAFESLNIDQTGTNAQESAIGAMQDAAANGGLSPAEEAKMGEILSQLRTTEKGANDAVVQNQAARGALTGGETMAAQLMNNQGAAADANAAGLKTAGDAYTQMLNEMTTAGQLGQGLQSQQNQQGNTVAAATDAINRFNAAQQQGQENLNVGNRNIAQEENLNNAQRVGDTNVANANEHAEKMANTNQTAYQDAMRKAEAEAGVHQNAAQNDTTQGGQEAGLIGGIVGAGGNAAAGMATKPPATKAYGGEIHNYLNGGAVLADSPGEQAVAAGDSPANDKIPAYLSEGEIVLPRTVAHSSPDRVMEFLNRVRKPKPHPEDVGTVLDALGHMRGGA